MQWSMHSAYWGQFRKDAGTGNCSEELLAGSPGAAVLKLIKM